MNIVSIAVDLNIDIIGCVVGIIGVDVFFSGEVDIFVLILFKLIDIGGSGGMVMGIVV